MDSDAPSGTFARSKVFRANIMSENSDSGSQIHCAFQSAGTSAHNAQQNRIKHACTFTDQSSI